jgi:hypothetical protein
MPSRLSPTSPLSQVKNMSPANLMFSYLFSYMQILFLKLAC